MAGPGGLTPNPAFWAGLNINDFGRLDESLGIAPLIDTLPGVPDSSSAKVRVEREGKSQAGSLGAKGTRANPD